MNKDRRLTCLFLISLFLSLRPNLAQAQTEHQQTIPTGWSALNHNLVMEDDRVAHLLVNSPEGLMFFKWLDGGWDVNQVQFGVWNDEGQRLAPGESGLVFNPGDPLDVVWTGTPQELEGFSGFWSSHTMIGEGVLEQAASGAAVHHYAPTDTPVSNQFRDQYPDVLRAEYVSIPGVFSQWSPNTPQLNGDPNEILLIEDPFVSSVVVDLPDRHLGEGGSAVYFNNYVPGFGVDAPIGQPLGCGFRGGALRSFPLFGDEETIVVRDDTNPPIELRVHADGLMAGYIDVQDGLVISHVSAEVFEEYDLTFDPESLPNGEYGAPAPPHILAGLQPTWILNPTIGGYYGLTPRSFHMTPENILAAHGDTVLIDLGLCEFTSHAARVAWEVLGDSVVYYLERQTAPDEWEVIQASSFAESFLLSNVSMEVEGVYRLRAASTDATAEWATYEDVNEFGEPFRIEVRSSTPEPARIHLLRMESGLWALSWEGDGRLQIAQKLDGPFIDADNQSNPQPLAPGAGPSQAFFRVVSNP